MYSFDANPLRVQQGQSMTELLGAIEELDVSFLGQEIEKELELEVEFQ